MSDEETGSASTETVDVATLQTQLTEAKESQLKMQKKMDELLSETKEAKRIKRETEEKALKDAEEAARGRGDVEAIDKSWQEKYSKRERELLDAVTDKESRLNKILIDNVAVSMAAELAVQGSADLLTPHIRSRLRAEIRDGEYMTVVTDKNGHSSAFSLQELKNEFISNPAFAPVIAGSKGSGGGATGQKSGGATQLTLKRSDFSSKDPASQMAFIKSGGTLTD